MRMVNGVMYLNDGDWVESCTALVEHGDGKLELIDWVARNKLSYLTNAASKSTATRADVINAVAAEIEESRAAPARV
jgi:hypothetical protein